jgi:hypothetical protein
VSSVLASHGSLEVNCTFRHALQSTVQDVVVSCFCPQPPAEWMVWSSRLHQTFPGHQWGTQHTMVGCLSVCPLCLTFLSCGSRAWHSLQVDVTVVWHMLGALYLLVALYSETQHNRCQGTRNGEIHWFFKKYVKRWSWKMAGRGSSYPLYWAMWHIDKNSKQLIQKMRVLSA